MGVKGISWIEQNIDKVVVGVFGVGLLGIIAMQFVGGGTTVKLTNLDGGGKPVTVPIEEAMSRVGARAKTIQDQITSPDPRELSEIAGKLPQSASVDAEFTKRLGTVAPHPKLVASLDKPRLPLIRTPGDSGKPATGNAQFMYAAVEPAAPVKPVGVSYLATIHPIEYVGKPDVAKILPADPLPKDKAAVSLETTFDGAALSQMLQADPDDAGPLSSLPAHWWSGENTQILAVNVERQELKPDGTWSDAVPVTAMPGRENMHAAMDKIATGGVEAMKTLMTDARAKAADIRKPKYYEIVFGEEWLTPSEATVVLASDPGTDAAPVDDKAKAKRELDDLDGRIAKLQDDRRKLDEVKKEDGKREERPSQPSSPPPGGRGRNAPPPSSATPSDPKAAAMKRLDDQIAKQIDNRVKLIERWRKRGVELEPEKMLEKNPAQPIAEKPVEAPELPLLDNSASKVLAHDVTVQRGKTYRYRMSLTLNNPIYSRVVANTPEQEALTKKPFVQTAFSDWSDPVSVEAETYYFMTSATTQDAIARGSRASADVFIFRWGYWRRGNVSVEPGDVLAADVKVPDLTKQVAMLLPAANGAPDPAANQPGRRGGPIDPIAGEQPKPDPIAYKQESVSHDAVMLEVAATAVLPDPSGKTKVENQVFLKETNGTIAVRSPDSDKSSLGYRRLASSAQRGEESLRPKVVLPTEGAPGSPGIGPKGKPDEPPPPSGGGGGG